MQKSKQKKSRLCLLHSKNLRSIGSTPIAIGTKLTPTKYVGAQTRTILNRLSHLFFGSPDKVGRLQADYQSLGHYADNHIKKHHRNKHWRNTKALKHGLFDIIKPFKDI